MTRHRIQIVGSHAGDDRDLFESADLPIRRGPIHARINTSFARHGMFDGGVALELILNIAVGISTSIVASWLYDRIKDKSAVVVILHKRIPISDKALLEKELDRMRDSAAAQQDSTNGSA